MGGEARGPPCGNRRRHCHLPRGQPALAHPRGRPGPRVTQWDRGEARPPSLCASQVYGKSSSSFRSLSSPPEVPPDAPTPPPAAAAAARRDEELVAGCVWVGMGESGLDLLLLPLVGTCAKLCFAGRDPRPETSRTEGAWGWGRLRPLLLGTLRVAPAARVCRALKSRSGPLI